MSEKIQDWEKEIFKDVVFLVEADSFAQHSLWLTHHANDVGLGHVLWEEGFRGHMLTLGELDGMPTCVVITYALINGKKVAFWDATSQVVDYRIVNKWLEKCAGHLRWDNGHRPARCDAMNFHHCVQAIEELNGARRR